MQLRRIGIYFLLLWLMAILVFSVWYLITDYNTLKIQYLSLNDCFYRSTLWTTEFFTPQVKSAGNKWCMVAIAVCIVGAVLLVRQVKKPIYTPNTFKLQPSFEVIIILLIAIGLTIYSYWHISPAYDEIFSAINIASLPTFQAWSYYMLPNNHILFNVVNGLLFAPFKDHVMTGRWLSMIAYLFTAVTIWYWLKSIMKPAPLRILVVLLLLVQLPVWGFSAQARGYSWQLFAGWTLFIHTLAYLRSKDVIHLLPVMWATWLGYALIPSFLHFHFGVMAFAVLYQLYQRTIDIKFWLYQTFAGALIFLFYLPALCFSGLGAFAENQYVTAGIATWEEFMPDFLSKFKYFVNYCFSFLLGENNRINYTLFALPLVLIFSKDRHKKLLGVFYVIMWTVFIVLVLYMKRNPFCRNLIVHYSITLALVAYTIYTGLYWLSIRVKMPLLSYVVFGLICAALSCHFIRTYPKNAITILYFNAANELYATNTQNIKTIPHSATVYLSPESFYWRYLRRKEGLSANYCQTYKEEYLVKRITGELTVIDTTGYQRVQSFPDDYELWKKK